MVLRPLLVSKEKKADMSPKDIRDIFYAIMGGIQDIKKEEGRNEERLRTFNGRLRALEIWAKENDEKKEKHFIEMQPGCPAVSNSRYCEVSIIALVTNQSISLVGTSSATGIPPAKGVMPNPAIDVLVASRELKKLWIAIRAYQLGGI
ncbi:unnamed protein product [Nippostrongylus brasiliensis]|uniref:Gag protein n=1 Tax=Nippostrongylus brasiliensis TaxID=27835 RepID=A0A0N4Y5W1_NIPBR|nr:unnamed protein product [Nippostrongylus brasiliensis]